MGIIGFGQFSRFMLPYLVEHFDVYISERSGLQDSDAWPGAKFRSFEEVSSKEIIIPSVPVQFFETILCKMLPFIQSNALVIDVCSVKLKPVEIMQRLLPETCEIMGTHPLFGPQSGKNGIQGLNFVVCPVRAKAETTKCLENLLQNVWKLNVLHKTPTQHDVEMAYVQALTHFIGRTVWNMNIPDVAQKTPAYSYLLQIKDNLGQDSFELFKSIQQENPYAEEVIAKFESQFQALKNSLVPNH